jgi:hypothetical protein
MYSQYLSNTFKILHKIVDNIFLNVSISVDWGILELRIEYCLPIFHLKNDLDQIIYQTCSGKDVE